MIKEPLADKVMKITMLWIKYNKHKTSLLKNNYVS